MEIKQNDELSDTQVCKIPKLTFVNKTVQIKASDDKLIRNESNNLEFDNDKILKRQRPEICISTSKELELIDRFRHPTSKSLDTFTYFDLEKASKCYREGIYMYFYTLKAPKDKGCQ